MSMYALFGLDAPFEQIVDCRVNRIRVEVRGIQTAIARATLGGRRTQVWLTLADGRTASAIAKDDPAQAEALERFLDALERDRVARWRHAMAGGEAVRVGKATLTREHLQVGGKKLAWSSIGGWSFRDGGLMVDGANHRLVFTLWIARTPWAGALARLLDVMAPGKDYEAMPPDQVPRMSFFATSALTHIPGAMTMRARGYLLGGMVAIGLAIWAGYYVWFELEHRRMERYWREGIAKDVAAWAPQLADPAFASYAPCEAQEYGRYNIFPARPGEPVGKLYTYPNNILVWDRVGADVRGLYVEDRFKDDLQPCRVTMPGSDGAALVKSLEEKPPGAPR